MFESVTGVQTCALPICAIWTFDAYPNFNGGVTVSSDDFGNNGVTDIFIAPNAGRISGLKTAPPVLVLKGTSLTGILVLNPYSNFIGGINVG
jgi:hypothetical protein